MASYVHTVVRYVGVSCHLFGVETEQWRRKLLILFMFKKIQVLFNSNHNNKRKQVCSKQYVEYYAKHKYFLLILTKVYLQTSCILSLGQYIGFCSCHITINLLFTSATPEQRICSTDVWSICHHQHSGRLSFWIGAQSQLRILWCQLRSASGKRLKLE